MILSVLKTYCLKTDFWVIGYVFLHYLWVFFFFNQFFYLEALVVLSPVDASSNSVDKRGNSSWAEV